MNIVKNITLAEFMVEPEEGKIWINAPNCVLRVQGLKFRNIREKFSMIDVNGDDATMIEANSPIYYMHESIEEIAYTCISNDFSKEDMDKILTVVKAIAICKRGENDKCQC